MQKIDMKHPDLWKKNPGVWAAFTLKNPSDKDSPELKTSGTEISSDPVKVDRYNKALWNTLNLDTDMVATASQIHSDKVTFVSEGGVYPETDALVTNIPGLTLGIRVADCAAILFADRDGGVIGAAHSGWRGTVGGIVSNTIDMMVRHGADPHKIEAYIGPCICTDCFEVGTEVAELFDPSVVDYTSYEKPHVDLKAEIRNQLLQKGIRNHNIETDIGCTMHDSELFYSYRREHERSGRMMALIRLSGDKQ